MQKLLYNVIANIFCVQPHVLSLYIVCYLIKSRKCSVLDGAAGNDVTQQVQMLQVERQTCGKRVLQCCTHVVAVLAGSQNCREHFTTERRFLLIKVF